MQPKSRKERPLRPWKLEILGACFALALVSGVSLADEWQPTEVEAARIATLSDEQQRFINSGAFLDFMPAGQMQLALSSRDEAALQRLVTDLLGVAGEMGYDPARDMGSIPLNTASKRFNIGITLPKVLRRQERSPGPFSVHRYLFPASGIPTFGGAAVAIWPEDLEAGQVDVAIVGVPNDMGSGRRNAEYGPRAMRALNTIAVPDTQTLLDPMQVLSVVDYGDFAIDNMSTERTVGHVTAMVAETAGTGAIPMMVGGDTSMLVPGVRGVAEVHGKGSFGLVHFSAHPDAERTAVHSISDDQALFLLLRDGTVTGSDLIAVGLRGPALTVDTLQWLRDQGVRYHTMAEINREGVAPVLRRVRDEVRGLPDKVFVSIDVSVLEPGDMVAAGRLLPNGLSSQDVTETIRHVCAAREVVGFEITDLAPMLDVSRLSTVHANAALNACLGGIAARRAGFTPDQIHPLARDHGQN